VPRSLLVVEDDPPVRRLLAEVLTRAGYAVRTADDGLAALAAVEVEPPDLVLTDLVMPRLDGVGLLARLRAAGQRVPVVLISAYDDLAAAVAAPFVAKPFAQRDLLAAIERELARPIGDASPEVTAHSPAACAAKQQTPA
jgi:DNA-binding response OmpR family regulator